MKISIEFDSCWETSFLDNDEKKPISKSSEKINRPSSDGYMQKFVATSGSRGEKLKPINIGTVLGVLCRLIGDQRKLYQARESGFYYFGDIEGRIQWSVNSKKVDELMYVTNKSDDRCAQSAFLGVLDDSNPWFFSKHSELLWSVLFLTKAQLLEFILSGEINRAINNDCLPKNLINRVNKLTDSKSDEGSVLKTKAKLTSEKQFVFDRNEKRLVDAQNKFKDKPPSTSGSKDKMHLKLDTLTRELVDARNDLDVMLKDPNMVLKDSRLKDVVDFLSGKFPDPKKAGEEYCKNGVIYPMSLYSAALYLQAERLLEVGFDMPFLNNSKGLLQIQGFSKRGFNGVRDWLNSMTGKRKKSVGTPCVVQKHSGKLDIEIILDNEKDMGIIENDINRASEIASLIERAGVSSFYLGKKGLAYVSDIRI